MPRSNWELLQHALDEGRREANVIAEKADQARRGKISVEDSNAYAEKWRWMEIDQDDGRTRESREDGEVA